MKKQTDKTRINWLESLQKRAFSERADIKQTCVRIFVERGDSVRSVIDYVMMVEKSKRPSKREGAKK